MRFPWRRSERGQVLVIVAGGLVVIVAMVGLVIDGGEAWTRQRDTQNGADAVSKAGTVVVQHYLAEVDTPAPNDYDVGCAVADAADANGVAVESAEYVDFQGEPLAPGVAVGSCTTDFGVGIPAGAQGVKARTSETFDTLLMSVIGVQQLTTVADAIAVVGALEGLPGGALPVTFPETLQLCDRVNPAIYTIHSNNGPPWEPYEIIDEADAGSSNEAIVPLCDIAPGSVGWLDWDCGQNLSDAITDPCDLFIPIPAWVHTQTGNVNALEDELNSYTGGPTGVGVPEPEDAVLALPIHNFTCDQDIPDPNPPSDCPSFSTWSGNGNNLYYHIPYWVGFKLDVAYTQGGDVECGQAPGAPLLLNPDPPGKVGCLKGWFVDRFDAPGPIGLHPIGPGSLEPLVVTLVN